jgi:DivIVA domain-containing protein
MGAVDRVRDVQFPLVLRGYDRAAVDAHLAEIAQLVAELEATQLRESVVQKALDEVGEQTAGILQHAHDTAEEIAARSRSQAEGRIQRAEREAELIRREAEQYADKLANDMSLLTEDRRRLIEELRTFAEDVLSVADDALERLPELLADRPEDHEDATQPTQQLQAAPEPEPAAEPEPTPEPQQEPEPEPEPEPPPAAPDAGRPQERTFEDDGVSEGVIRVERRPKPGSS